jgi:hypothetical protein
MTESIMDSVKIDHVGGALQYLPISSFSQREADRAVWRCTSTRITESIMDSVKIDHVGAVLQYPPISPLSLRERVRVRGF